MRSLVGDNGGQGSLRVGPAARLDARRPPGWRLAAIGGNDQRGAYFAATGQLCGGAPAAKIIGAREVFDQANI